MTETHTPPPLPASYQTTEVITTNPQKRVKKPSRWRHVFGCIALVILAIAALTGGEEAVSGVVTAAALLFAWGLIFLYIPFKIIQRVWRAIHYNPNNPPQTVVVQNHYHN